MRVLRHEHERSQLHFTLDARRVNARGQMLSPSVVREQGLAFVTREGQFV
jgi:hypothetical protein